MLVIGIDAGTNCKLLHTTFVGVYINLGRNENDFAVFLTCGMAYSQVQCERGLTSFLDGSSVAGLIWDLSPK